MKNCIQKCKFEEANEAINEEQRRVLSDFVKRMQNVDVKKLDECHSKGWANLFSNVFCDVVLTGDALSNLDYAGNILDALEHDDVTTNKLLDYIKNNVYKSK